MMKRRLQWKQNTDKNKLPYSEWKYKKRFDGKWMDTEIEKQTGGISSKETHAWGTLTVTAEYSPIGKRPVRLRGSWSGHEEVALGQQRPLMII